MNRTRMGRLSPGTLGWIIVGMVAIALFDLAVR